MSLSKVKPVCVEAGGSLLGSWGNSGGAAIEEKARANTLANEKYFIVLNPSNFPRRQSEAGAGYKFFQAKSLYQNEKRDAKLETRKVNKQR